MKLLFFIGTLRSGGKERRLIELLSFLKKNSDFELLVVLRQNQIDYSDFYNFDTPYKLLTKKYKRRDILLHLHFYKICKTYKPDIIHTWGSMPAFVLLLAKIFQRIPHINSQITSAPPSRRKWSLSNIINRVNFCFSDIIVSNSIAGLRAYKPPYRKSMVIYNGIRLERFANLPIIEQVKSKYHITTPYSVIMVASFTKNKNYDLYIEIGEYITKIRNDISFTCVGDGENFQRLVNKSRNNLKIIFTGRIDNVEDLVNVCDIGVLFSPNGEGISNSILEYMALSKPVIANDTGGTKEIIKHGQNGYLISKEDPEEISGMIIELIENPQKRKVMGKEGRKMIEDHFTVEKMGNAFEKVYKDVLKGSK